MKKSVIALLHLGYWTIFSMLLVVFFLLCMPMIDKSHQKHEIYLLARWVYLMVGFAIIPGVIAFYSFYTFLFTKFLSRNKFLALFFSALAVSFVAALVGGLALSFIFFNYKFMFADGINSASTEIEVMTFGALMNGIIGLVMRGFITWYGDIKLKDELNKKNYEMELALIKSQISPHFLFNTINNIDVLIEKDAFLASAYLNKLSDIMRFMLYETKTDKISLAREVTFIEKYIDLQRIRTLNPDYVNYSHEGRANNLMIEPMLFIPFIENAFKYAENKKIENAIKILIITEKDKITFNCENNYSQVASTQTTHNGLGNELIQKRLNLLYPGKHLLEITNQDNIYKVNLILYYDAN